MPEFKVKTPDGNVITVRGPEGSTEAQAIDYAKKNYKPQQSAASPAFHEETDTDMQEQLAKPEKPGVMDFVKEQFNDPKGLSLIGTAGNVYRGAKDFFSTATKLGSGEIDPSTPEGSLKAVEAASQVLPTTSASRIGRAAAETALPTLEGMKKAAGAGYDYLRKAKTTISGEGVDALHAHVIEAISEDFDPLVAGATYGLIDKLPNGPATIAQIDAVRRRLGNVPVTNPSDRTAANRAINAIDDYLTKIPEDHVLSGDPKRDAAILKRSQGNWAAAKRLEDVQQANTKALHGAGSTGSGANIVNRQRQKLREIIDSDAKSRGFSPEIKDKIEEIVMGTRATNTARYLSKWAPTGSVSGMAGLLAGETLGPGVGLTVAGTGLLGRYLGQYLTNRQIRAVEDMIKESSPLGRPAAAARAAEKAAPSTLPENAALRAGAAAATDRESRDDYLANPGQQGLQ